MIISGFLSALNYIIDLLVGFAPKWVIWPDSLLNGLTYVFKTIGSFDFILPIKEMFNIMLFLIAFEVGFFTLKMILRAINWIRGSGEI
jgi:hypothetical protein